MRRMILVKVLEPKQQEAPRCYPAVGLDAGWGGAEQPEPTRQSLERLSLEVES